MRALKSGHRPTPKAHLCGTVAIMGRKHRPGQPFWPLAASCCHSVAPEWLQSSAVLGAGTLAPLLHKSVRSAYATAAHTTVCALRGDLLLRAVFVQYGAHLLCATVELCSGLARADHCFKVVVQYCCMRRPQEATIVQRVDHCINAIAQ